jgi:flavodoxin
MKNTLGDLNNHLFAQLERLGDEDIKGENLQEEINRAHAITAIATQIIANGALVLKARRIHDNQVNADDKLPKMLEG